jgi:hypothetical protein
MNAGGQAGLHVLQAVHLQYHTSAGGVSSVQNVAIHTLPLL